MPRVRGLYPVSQQYPRGLTIKNGGGGKEKENSMQSTVRSNSFFTLIVIGYLRLVGVAREDYLERWKRPSNHEMAPLQVLLTPIKQNMFALATDGISPLDVHYKILEDNVDISS